VSPHAFTEDQLVEQPAVALFAELGWPTVSASDEVFGPKGTLQRETKSDSDSMFRLQPAEAEILRSQSATLRMAHGAHRKYAPNVFTEQGVAMLSSVLRSPHAVQVNIEIMRALVRLRRMLDSNAELSRKIEVLEEKFA
jgi:hypothetical protein